MKYKIKPLILLNFSTIVLGTSGVLSQLITTSIVHTILFRGFITAFILFPYLFYSKKLTQINLKQDWFFFFFSGALLAGHWISYFYAIDKSTVAIGFLSMFSFPVITALLEPILIKKSKFSYWNLLTAILVFIGLWQLVPQFSLQNNSSIGVILGIISALLYSFRNIWNKTKIEKYDGALIMFFQCFSTGFFLLPSLFSYNLSSTTSNDLICIILLSFVTTALGHTLFVKSLEYFNTTTVSIMSCLQPIYGIIYAAILINEKVTINIYIGGSIILATVLFESIKNIVLETKKTST